MRGWDDDLPVPPDDGPVQPWSREHVLPYLVPACWLLVLAMIVALCGLVPHAVAVGEAAGRWLLPGLL